MKETIQFVLNNKKVRLKVRKDRKLLWVLRTDLGLTSAKYGCGEGFCGACTVLIDNRAVQSCQIPVSDVKGKNVLTIEGLAQKGKLHPLQSAFVEQNALQCGFCTPGMILRAYSLLKRNSKPDAGEIIRHMEGNLCRCGDYGRIVKAIQIAGDSICGGRL